jgi:moderate conductance mechanosensitive channel
MLAESMTLVEEWQTFIRDLFSPEQMTQYGLSAVKVGFIILGSYMILKISNRVIDTGFALRKLPNNKHKTLTKLLKSIIRYAVFFIAAMMILINIGLDPTPVLAGAGVAGLAIGFGAQNLVRDIITGFFVIFEDQLNVGDYVMINNSFEGTVEELGLRVTQVREWSGKLHYVPNGEITQITNYSRDYMRPVVDVKVPYEENMSAVFRKLDQVCLQIGQKYEQDLLEAPSIYGITDITNQGVQFTVTAISKPDQYWFIERQMRKEIVESFHEEEIEIAYPRRVLMDRQSAPYVERMEL